MNLKEYTKIAANAHSTVESAEYTHCRHINLNRDTNVVVGSLAYILQTLRSKSDCNFYFHKLYLNIFNNGVCLFLYHTYSSVSIIFYY